MKSRVKIFSDGSARGNPGPGGFGTILQYTDAKGKLHEKEISEGFRMTTNNRMELMGAIKGFEALNKPCEVELISDSRYVIDAFREKWIETWKKENWRKGKKNEVKNIDLWERLLAAMESHDVLFTWVKGHNDHPENERCDALATAAADGDNLSEDDNYGQS